MLYTTKLSHEVHACNDEMLDIETNSFINKSLVHETNLLFLINTLEHDCAYEG